MIEFSILNLVGLLVGFSIAYFTTLYLDKILKKFFK